MKKVSYNHIKPQNYYNHLLTFFAVIALTITFSLVKFEIKNIEIFFLKFIIILFILLFISVLLEFFYKSEYMDPIEIYKIEKFVNNILDKIQLKNHESFFNKYDIKSKKKFKLIFDKKADFYLSSIRKHKNIYEVTIINEEKMLIFLLSRLLGKSGVHKLFLEDNNKEFKIVRFS